MKKETQKAMVKATQKVLEMATQMVTEKATVMVMVMEKQIQASAVDAPNRDCV